MEACIVICRKQKSSERVGKVLFINARDEVTRKNAQSYLEEKHIKRIASVYHGFSEIEGFSKTATIREIQDNKSKLSVALYVNHDDEETETVETADCISEWSKTSMDVSKALNELNQMLAL
jgi:type I restriction enzyme M protein